MIALVTRLPTDYLDSLEHDEMPEPGGRARPFDLLDDTQVEHLPPISWLADQIVPFGGLCAMYGPPGSGKSFVAIDLAFSVALGIPWLGREVMTGGALYFAAEGRGGLGQRVAAWKSRHERRGHTLGVGFHVSSINLLEPITAARIVATVETHSAIRSPCQLIVIDTLARSMIGDENDTGDMSQLIATIDRVRELTESTVLLVHHTKKDSDLERGSSALRGGVDTLIFCQEGDDGRQLVCEKQKDAEAFQSIPFALSAGFGSCVVTSTVGDSPDGLTGPGSITPQRLRALRSLADAFTARGATKTEWMRATEKVPERTFYSVTAWLVREGYVAENGTRYTMTPSGRGAVAARLNGSRGNPVNLSTAIDLQNLVQSPPGTRLKPVPGVHSAGITAKGTANSHDDAYYADLLAEADERIGMREDA